MASTAAGAAAQALLSPPTQDINPFKSGAICSKIITTVFDGLEILREGVQDAEGNCWSSHCDIPYEVLFLQ